jgi:hypothetical protein
MNVPTVKVIYHGRYDPLPETHDFRVSWMDRHVSIHVPDLLMSQNSGVFGVTVKRCLNMIVKAIVDDMEDEIVVERTTWREEYGERGPSL